MDLDTGNSSDLLDTHCLARVSIGLLFVGAPGFPVARRPGAYAHPDGPKAAPIPKSMAISELTPAWPEQSKASLMLKYRDELN